MYLNIEERYMGKLVDMLMEKIESVTRMCEYYHSDLENEKNSNAEVKQRIEALEAEIKLLHEEREKLRNDNKELIDTFMYRDHRSELPNPLQQ